MLNSSLSHFKNYFVFLKLKKKDGMKPVTVTSQITYQEKNKPVLGQVHVGYIPVRLGQVRMCSRIFCKLYESF